MIRTRPATKEYLDNWDKAFGDKSKKKPEGETSVVEAPAKATKKKPSADLGSAEQSSGKKRKRKPA